MSTFHPMIKQNNFNLQDLTFINDIEGSLLFFIGFQYISSISLCHLRAKQFQPEYYLKDNIERIV